MRSNRALQNKEIRAVRALRERQVALPIATVQLLSTYHVTPDGGRRDRESRLRSAEDAAPTNTTKPSNQIAELGFQRAGIGS